MVGPNKTYVSHGLPLRVFTVDQEGTEVPYRVCVGLYRQSSLRDVRFVFTWVIIYVQIKEKVKGGKRVK